MQHTPHLGSHPSQGSQDALTAPPPTSRESCQSTPGRGETGGQARLGVGPWRPGPGTRQRKFQAVLQAAFRAAHVGDRQQVGSSRAAAFFTWPLSPGHLALQPQLWGGAWQVELGETAVCGREPQPQPQQGQPEPLSPMTGGSPTGWLWVGSCWGWQAGAQTPSYTARRSTG